MNYRAEITVNEDADNLCKMLGQENMSRERSGLKLKKKGSSLIITIEANDAVALRASMNAVSQVLAVHSKMKGAR